MWGVATIYNSPSLPDSLRSRVGGDTVKLALVNLLSLAFICLISKSYTAPLLVGSYTLVTYLYIELIESVRSQRYRTLLYHSFLYAHAFVFVTLQYYGFIGILNLENVTNPSTLPLLIGFSFYVLQVLAIGGAVYRKKLVPLSFQRYALATFFFGKFLAGPLLNGAELERIRICKISLPSAGAIYSSVHLFIGGLFFKLVLANWVARWVNIREVGSALGIAKSVLAFEFQVYFDFAGYSLIALFFCRIFGVPMYFNFQHPFAARDIPEFWRRWHVGLGTWFKENVFTPLKSVLGSHWGSRGIIPLAVFFISAAWHGPTRNFLVWGVFHGFAYVFAVNAVSRFKTLRGGLLISKIYVIGAVLIGRMLFMDSDFARQMTKFKTLFSIHKVREESALLLASFDGLSSMTRFDKLNAIVICTIVALLVYELTLPKRESDQAYKYLEPRVVSVLLLIFTLLFMEPIGSVAFVYGR